MKEHVRNTTRGAVEGNGGNVMTGGRERMRVTGKVAGLYVQEKASTE